MLHFHRLSPLRPAPLLPQIAAHRNELGTSRADANHLRLSYSYGTTQNNGNVRSQTITAPNLALTQTYSYDEVNRLRQPRR